MVRATKTYTAQSDEELSFSAGEFFNCIEEIDKDWLRGEFTSQAGRVGMFPASYVTKMKKAGQ